MSSQGGKLTVFKKNDELPDCVRYACQGMPILPPDPTTSTTRDISHLSEKAQDDIKHMRKWGAEDDGPGQASEAGTHPQPFQFLLLGASI